MRCSRRRSTRELPFLGICRGAQMLNVALGGTLTSTCPTSSARPLQPGERRLRRKPTVGVDSGLRAAPASCGDDELDVQVLPPPGHRRVARRARRHRPHRRRHDPGGRAAERCRSASPCSGTPRRTPPTTSGSSPGSSTQRDDTATPSHLEDQHPHHAQHRSGAPTVSHTSSTRRPNTSSRRRADLDLERGRRRHRPRR